MRPLFRLLLPVVIVTLSGCGWLVGDEGYFRDRGDDYRNARSIPPMQVPEDKQERGGVAALRDPRGAHRRAARQRVRGAAPAADPGQPGRQGGAHPEARRTAVDIARRGARRELAARAQLPDLEPDRHRTRGRRHRADGIGLAVVQERHHAAREVPLPRRAGRAAQQQRDLRAADGLQEGARRGCFHARVARRLDGCRARDLDDQGARELPGQYQRGILGEPAGAGHQHREQGLPGARRRAASRSSICGCPSIGPGHRSAARSSAPTCRSGTWIAAPVCTS